MESFGDRSSGSNGCSAGRLQSGGKMPVSTAYSAGQIPHLLQSSQRFRMASAGEHRFCELCGSSHTPRYCFGHGLSYTKFVSRIWRLKTVKSRPVKRRGSCCTVENTGKCAGDEVVQLHLRDRFASMTRPVKELAGFSRVHFEPGKKSVCLYCRRIRRQLLDRQMNWKVEKGDIDVENWKFFRRYPLKGRIPVTQV